MAIVFTPPRFRQSEFNGIYWFYFYVERHEADEIRAWLSQYGLRTIDESSLYKRTSLTVPIADGGLATMFKLAFGSTRD